jgi:hypothetical protein
MVWRIAVVSAIAIMIAGCGTTGNGVDFVSMSQKVGPPKAGQGRIVLLRQAAYKGVLHNWDIKLDDAPMGDLKSGTYLYADRPTGRHRLSYSEAFFPGDSQREITLSPGRISFFLVKRSDRAQAIDTAGLTAGLAGYAVMSAVTKGDSNPGPLDFIPLEEAAARETIAGLQSAE